MNKIFRIVWNEAAQAWVAVSELTKKHKKRASVTPLQLLLLLACFLLSRRRVIRTRSRAVVSLEL